MSKYIIEIPDDVPFVLLRGEVNGKFITEVVPVTELEKLGCDGCKYYEDTSLTNPCSECSRGHVDHYKPVSDPDPIKVGDKVIVPSNSHVEPGELLSIVNGVCYIMWEDKTVSAYRIDGVRCVK